MCSLLVFIKSGPGIKPFLERPIFLKDCYQKLFPVVFFDSCCDISVMSQLPVTYNVLKLPCCQEKKQNKMAAQTAPDKKPSSRAGHMCRYQCEHGFIATINSPCGVSSGNMLAILPTGAARGRLVTRGWFGELSGLCPIPSGSINANEQMHL